MREFYYVIRGLLEGGFWNEDEKEFKGILFAYKIKDKSVLAFNKEFEEARKKSSYGVELVKVYK